MAAQAKLDKVLRDLAKENAALLELVAYGKSVFPSKDQFVVEHDNFVNNLYEAFSGFEATGGRPGFVLTTTISDKHELLMKGTFGKEKETETRPQGVLLDWLLETFDKCEGPIGSRIGNWLANNNGNQVHVVPYLVTKPWNGLQPGDVPIRMRELREDREALDQFVYTTPFMPSANARDTLPTDFYFSSYACVGVTTAWTQAVGPKVNISALLEALMVFYQMSWSNYRIIKESEVKQQEKAKAEAMAEAKARERETLLMFSRIRDPIETLVKQLQAAQQPLNRLQVVLSPVRGLFGSSFVPEELYRSGPRTVEIQGGPYVVSVRHTFDEFKAIEEFAKDVPRRHEAVAEQIAAVVLAGLSELQNAKKPLWEHLRYRLHCSDSYKPVADILLDRWPAFETASKSLQEAELRELFDGIKYWFNYAGRPNVWMRADFLIAGVNLLFKEGSRARVESDLEDSTRFWVPSLLPVQTLSGLEALVHDCGSLKCAKLELKNDGALQTVRLTLNFSKAEVGDHLVKTNANLKGIHASCLAWEKLRNDAPLTSATAGNDGDIDDRFRPTRGSMVFAILELFGCVPEYDEKDGSRLTISKASRLMWLGFPKDLTEVMPVRIEWAAPQED